MGNLSRRQKKHKAAHTVDTVTELIIFNCAYAANDTPSHLSHPSEEQFIEN